jgi:hypothetical protein
VNPSFTATICSKIGCGTTTLTDFLRYGKVPTLSLVPNPASSVTTVQSNVDLGQVQIELYDVLGTVKAQKTAELGPADPAEINTSSLPAGLYSVRILYGGSASSVRLMHIR